MKVVLHLIVLVAISQSCHAEITRVWLTHASPSAERLTVNWQTAAVGDSVVEYGADETLGRRAEGAKGVTLHRVEIPLGANGLHYRVRTGEEVSRVFRVVGYGEDVLRVAVFADAGYAKRPWAQAIAKERPHLILSAGDNVKDLHSDAKRSDPAGVGVGADRAGADARANVEPFGRLIDLAPEMFATTPFMPVLGNHDREVRPRGPKPPAEAVYDVEATAFRRFFPLPAPGWRWHFDVPAFGVRFAALDMSHVADEGTTWQTNHPLGRDSEQFKWYADLIGKSDQPYFVTLYNERNATVRGLEKGEWGRMIARGSLAITGFGYFAERAETDDGFSWFNTSVSGTGAKYPDPKSKVIESKDNFVLMTFRRQGGLVVELKSLDGEAIDRREMKPRVIGR